MHSDTGISIWFFIGSLLTIYGVLILGYGLYSLVSPPAQPTVLAELHADVWWGGVLLVLGLVYSFKHLPRRKS